MKMTKDDIRALKNKHQLEKVMEETGEVFEIDSKHPDLWRSLITPGLIVDIRRQLFEIKLPGMNDESGDVIAWLQRRFKWTFGMAVNFLQKRLADPPREDPPRSAKAKKIRIVQRIEDDLNPLDHWQEKALQIGGDRIRQYFSWSYWNLVLYRIREGVRIDPTYAPQITHCQRCDKHLDWLGELEENLMQAHNIPIIAYSIKRSLSLSDLGVLGRDETKDALNDLIDALGNLFVEEENGIVCPYCAAKEMKFQIALSLCERSAQRREESQDEEKTSVTGGRGGIRIEPL